MTRIGIDLGGTATKAGLFTEDGTLLDKTEFPTLREGGRAALLSDIADHVRALAERNGVPLSDCAAAIGVPGPVEDGGYTEAIPNLGFRDCRPGRELEALLGIPVRVLNDANAAALGEAWKGAGRGAGSMICVTLGTGVGAGIVIGGSVIGGSHGLGGEIGHILINPDETEPCGCGAVGCLDQVSSANGVARYAKKFLAEGLPAAFETVSADVSVGEAPSPAPAAVSVLASLPAITAKDVCDAAKAGDPLALGTLRYCMSFLGKALCIIGYTVDPAVCVIGGGLSKAGPFLLDVIRDAYTDLPKLTSKRMDLRLAELGNDAGMTGAARYAAD